MHPKVINISNKTLTMDEEKILNLGPKFIPTPEPDIESQRKDIQAYCRKLRLTEYASKHEIAKDDSIVSKPSSFTPSNNDTYLEKHIDYLTNYPLKMNQH